MFCWTVPFALGDVDDLPDSFLQLTNFRGVDGSTVDGFVQLGVNDGDTVKGLLHTTDIADTQLRSVHLDDDSTSYQNTTGLDSVVVLQIRAVNSGTTDRNFKVYTSPNDNSKTGATEVFSMDVISYLNALNDVFTTPPLAIKNNHFCVVENNSGDATSDIDVLRESRVVERTGT